MAIQIRRGSNAEWESNNSNIVVGEPAVATDSKRAFIGTASGAYMELANLEAIAPAYDPENSYMVDDYVSYQGKLYVCTVPTSGAWNASCWQVTSLGQALAENAYSNFETYTMSGDIVSFPNGAGGIPVKDLKADVVAVQDLNGYDAPWVGGAGKNKVNGDEAVKENVLTKNSTNNYTFTKYANTTAGRIPTAMAVSNISGSYYFSFKASAQHASTIQLRIKVDDSWGSGVTMSYSDGYYGRSITIEENTTAIQFYFYGNDTGVGDSITISDIQLESGSSRTTYEPYENICPITGWDGANVCVEGKNLFGGDFFRDGIKNSISAATDDPTNRCISYAANATASQPFTTVISGLFKPNTQYTFILKINKSAGSNGNANMRINYSDGTYTTIDGFSAGETVTNYKRSSANKTVVSLVKQNSGGTTTLYYDESGIFEGALTTADFIPFNGTTYSVTWTDSGTVYGGTLDVTTGVLTLTHGVVDLGDLTWSLHGSYANTFYADVTGKKQKSIDFISSAYSNGGTFASYANLQNGVMYASSGDNPRVALKNTSYTTASDFKTAMSGQTLVFELATPQVVQLTPQQVRTVLGQNNIWADSGEVEVTYRISNVQ